MSCVLAYTHIIGGFDIHLVNWEGTFQLVGLKKMTTGSVKMLFSTENSIFVAFYP